MTTGIDLAIYPSESPDEIAAKLLENILIPILRGKFVNDGEDAAVQLYRNLVYGLCRSRVEMIGTESVIELCDIANEIDVDYFDGAMGAALRQYQKESNENPDSSNFIEFEGKLS